MILLNVTGFTTPTLHPVFFLLSFFFVNTDAREMRIAKLAGIRKSLLSIYIIYNQMIANKHKNTTIFHRLSVQTKNIQKIQLTNSVNDKR